MQTDDKKPARPAVDERSYQVLPGAPLQIVTWGQCVELQLIGCTPTGEFMFTVKTASRWPAFLYARSAN